MAESAVQKRFFLCPALLTVLGLSIQRAGQRPDREIATVASLRARLMRPLKNVIWREHFWNQRHSRG
jgi:hypothetical protein